MMKSTVGSKAVRGFSKTLVRFAAMLLVLPFLLPIEAFASNAYIKDTAPQFIEKIRESYGEMVNIAALLHDTDPKLILAVIVVESEGNEKATSHKGAQGLMQLMPLTAKSMGAKNPKEPFQNILAGTRYLKELQNKYGFNSPEEALVAYNMGPSRAHRWLSQYSPDEYTYVKNVMYVYRILDEEEEEKLRLAAQVEKKLAEQKDGPSFDTNTLLAEARALSLNVFPMTIPSGRRTELEFEN